jgi:hypothetical protein
MKKILLALMIMFSVVGHTQTDTTGVSDSLRLPLEEFYLARPFMGMVITSEYYSKRNGVDKLHKHLVTKGYLKATTNAVVNSDIHKKVNSYRKELGLSKISTESILNQKIISNNQNNIVNIVNDFDEPIILRIISDEPDCECAKSIYDGLISEAEIFLALKDPATTYFDAAYYQLSKNGNCYMTLTIVTYITDGLTQHFIFEGEGKLK